MSGRGHISVEPKGECTDCGRDRELRPYGPRGERICFECAMATPESKSIAERQMRQLIFGEMN